MANPPQIHDRRAGDPRTAPTDQTGVDLSADCSEVMIPPTDLAPGTRASKMLSILAVDDSASMRRIVSFTLKSAGYEVVEAVDGEDAFDKANARDFDLILTDQNMPRLDGIGLTRRLREHPGFKATPILILTTESSDQMKQAGKAAGANGWLVKPFDPNRLVEVVLKVMQQAGARAATSEGMK
jgi:two-component system chemotaxis response regulator CheY